MSAQRPGSFFWQSCIMSSLHVCTKTRVIFLGTTFDLYISSKEKKRLKSNTEKIAYDMFNYIKKFNGFWVQTSGFCPLNKWLFFIPEHTETNAIIPIKSMVPSDNQLNSHHIVYWKYCEFDSLKTNRSVSLNSRLGR